MRAPWRLVMWVAAAGAMGAAGWAAGCAPGPRGSEAAATSAAPAGTWQGAAGPLGYLAAVRPGRSARVTSAPPERSSNWDNRLIPPGKTHVLAEIEGPGTIQHIWMTFPEPAPGWLGREGNADHSELVLRIFWDGASEPAVETPVGDFFAAGFGERAEVHSAAVLVEGGDAYNCYWPMPFRKSARIEVENQSAKPLGSFYYQVDYEKVPSLGADVPYFCAQYRQEFPTVSGRDYLILDAEGRGHYVGTVLSVRSRSPMWFGEGDEKFYVDGEKTPSLQGTGTEDYVGNAWGMGTGTYAYFGVPILEGDFGMVGWRTTVYRWHLPDPVRFTKRLRVEIEDAGWISKDELNRHFPFDSPLTTIVSSFHDSTLPLGARHVGFRRPDPLSGWPGSIEARVLGLGKKRFPHQGQTAFAVPLRFV